MAEGDSRCVAAIITNEDTEMSRITTHPGEMLYEEFIRPHGLSMRKVAQLLGVPTNRVSQLVRGERGMTADTALRLEKLFGMPAYMWIGFQVDHDLSRARSENDYSAVQPFAEACLAA
jgi:addiction module HigA family antidote